MEANEREEVLKKLAAAHDSYVEITGNLREGTKVRARQEGLAVSLDRGSVRGCLHISAVALCSF